MGRFSLRRALFVGAACAALALPAAAPAAEKINSKPLRDAVTVPGILQHEQALQDIANDNNGTRAAGTSGNDATLDYIESQLRSYGYQVTRQPFEFPFFQELSPASFERTAPTARTYGSDDFATMTYSGSGDVTGNVQEVNNNQFPPGETASSSHAGCDAADFAGFTAGNVALIQRGTCPFGQKATNAQNAGASAVLIFNEGQPGRTDAIAGTLGSPDFHVPVLGLSFAAGEELHNLLGSGDVTVHAVTDTISEIRTTANIIGDSVAGDPSRTMVVSAHNDSVIAGPGINDDGSGTATDLEIAKQMAVVAPPRNRLRFIFVGAEELGLLGSKHYVATLSDADKSQIAGMLDFDMLASPNYARLVYDGDGSTFGDAGPDGSGMIEDIFDRYFDSQGQAHEPIPFDGRSDYQPFVDAGIPAGGIFTGAEVVKTPEQQALYGGQAGVAFDECYHQACDTIDNLNHQGLSEMSDAAADAVFQLARTRGAITDPSATTTAKQNHRKSVQQGPQAIR